MYSLHELVWSIINAHMVFFSRQQKLERQEVTIELNRFESSTLIFTNHIPWGPQKLLVTVDVQTKGFLVQLETNCKISEPRLTARVPNCCIFYSSPWESISLSYYLPNCKIMGSILWCQMSQMTKINGSVFGVGTESQANKLQSAQSLRLNFLKVKLNERSLSPSTNVDT